MKANIRGNRVMIGMVNLTSFNIADEKINLASKYFFPKLSIQDLVT